jgi:proteasome lid subunit RPN8/RPN11
MAAKFEPNLGALSAALYHAQQSDPLESCGLIADGEYFPLINKATDHDTFVMDERGYIRVAREHTVEAIVHSHVYKPPLASDGDRAMCEKMGLPWLIVSWPTGRYAIIKPSGYRAPLVGRQWAWGTHDCFGLIQDGFEDHTGIRIPDFPREWMWWKNGQNIIATQFEQAGFVQIAQDSIPQHCDVMGMQISSPVVNHLGLFLAPDKLLHQMMGRLSVRDVYGGLYRHATVLHLRHENFLMAAPPIREVADA